jgi:hypothetical protein
MKKNKSKILILVLIIVLTLFFDISFLSYKTNLKENSPPPLSSPLIRGRLGRGLAILEIDGTKYQSQIEGETNIADFMKKLRNEGKIKYKEKNYIGMGEFIEEINGIKNSGEKNWIYYVNGEKAKVGVSNYKINNGDIVSWKYEKENF